MGTPSSSTRARMPPRPRIEMLSAVGWSWEDVALGRSTEAERRRTSSRAWPGVSAIAWALTTLTLSGTSLMDRAERVAVTTTDSTESDLKSGAASAARVPGLDRNENNNTHDPTVARLRIGVNISASLKANSYDCRLSGGSLRTF